ncbi:glutamine synthetase III [Pontibacter sp. G13]|uniref:glutamine synthetase III family protein n=1 Tax=Pontibacter sp. G13 TaxID=3074898 RepID=UPI00288A0562|nr:glutamine synthetase III [Pontibacter sp. G13]WNJ19259.1 glutamine synthetase III [Pontibacter sp. G13]
MMNPRFQALQEIQTREWRAPMDKTRRPSEIFAENVFTKKRMKHYLSKEEYLALKECIEEGRTLDRKIADPVANAIKAWAMDRGATHYTHWFQPLTGRTAEKHDSFLNLSDDEAIDSFSGTELAQQEPDASSFPSGGLRRTFEARGYTAWDCSSPVFIYESDYGKTLCIPTIFVSYTGEALDFKIPLLKSMALIDKAAVGLVKIFEEDASRVVPTLGIEQEYFLIDRAYFNLRPDLILTGRTVFGQDPARGQQLDDHYFGSIPQRAFAFMNELERECHKVGIPLKTRHNEVAPSQFECAPQFEPLNVAVDHGMLVMDLIDRVAEKHNLAPLLHEKPFAGINGSGKHNNWSLMTDTGKNLLSPDVDPEGNLMFLSMFVTVIKAVHDYADVLRASIASAGNDHRLGANEAPPAIISVFVGSKLSKILDDIENPPRRKRNENVSDLMHLGIAEIPELLKDNTDRNRTSPFAFTGNKFEFRAVGSSANSSSAMTVLNAIVANTLTLFTKKVESKIKRGRKRDAAVLDVIKEFITESKSIRFEGDGYSEDWRKEAEKRGLSNAPKTAHALEAFLSKQAKEALVETGIFTQQELHARYEVLMENYLTKVKIEADMIRELSLTSVVPSATRYQGELIDILKNGKDAGLKKGALSAQTDLANEIGECIKDIWELNEQMAKTRSKLSKLGSIRDEGIGFSEKVLPYFDQIRAQVDKLEGLVPDECWPLPKYREMLFVH